MATGTADEADTGLGLGFPTMVVVGLAVGDLNTGVTVLLDFRVGLFVYTLSKSINGVVNLP